VIENVWLRIQHGFDIAGVTGEVRNKDFDGTARRRVPDSVDGGRECRGSTIRKVVSVDRRHDDMIKREVRDRGANATGLSGVNRGGPSVYYVAVSARARAGITKDHERCGSMTPALTDIGAVGFLTYGSQVQLPQ
jgi:hypothetical protein